MVTESADIDSALDVFIDWSVTVNIVPTFESAASPNMPINLSSPYLRGL